MATASEVIKVALNEVGYLEKKTCKDLDSKTANAGSDNYTKYARDLDSVSYYNGRKQGQPWCAVFNDWCLVKVAGIEEAKRITFEPTTGNLSASCTYSVKYFKKHDRWSKVPQKGARIFFGTEEKATHTGLVYDFDEKNVYTVEGNTSNAAGVVANGGCVTKKSYPRTYSKIAGYGLPLYEIEAPKVAQPTIKKSKKTNDKEQVKLLQEDLNWLGFTGKDKKPLAIDGSCGSNTYYAIKEYQKKYGLEVDGSYGPASAKKMAELIK